MPGRILPDHPHAFGKLIDRRENLFRELIEQLVHVSKERTERLPVVVLVIRIENERVGSLAPKFLHDRIVRIVLAGQLMRERAGISACGCVSHVTARSNSRAGLVQRSYEWGGFREEELRTAAAPAKKKSYSAARYAAMAIISSGLSFETTGSMIALRRVPC